MTVKPKQSAAARMANSPWRGQIAVFNRKAAMARAIASGYVERKKPDQQYAEQSEGLPDWHPDSDHYRGP